mmetsp:Transcript_21117/g.59039  ORF Transcript_21117/g.59039 Transcript_21117/m.59039 type:complete len:268 (-) Transcript_21117:291-1094(-)
MLCIDRAHAERAPLAPPKPSVCATPVEVVSARQPSHRLTDHVLAEAHGTARPVVRQQTFRKVHHRKRRDLVRCGSLDLWRIRPVGDVRVVEDEAEANESNDGAGNGLEDYCDGHPVHSRASVTVARVDHPHDAQDEPAIQKDRHLLAPPPRWARCEIGDAGLQAAANALGCVHLREKDEAHRDLHDLQQRVHEQPPPEWPVAAAATSPEYAEKERARRAHDHAPDASEPHHSPDKPNRRCWISSHDFHERIIAMLATWTEQRVGGLR